VIKNNYYKFGLVTIIAAVILFGGIWGFLGVFFAIPLGYGALF